MLQWVRKTTSGWGIPGWIIVALGVLRDAVGFWGDVEFGLEKIKRMPWFFQFVQDFINTRWLSPILLFLGFGLIFYSGYRKSRKERVQTKTKNQKREFPDPLEITIPPVESTFSTAPTPLDALFNDHLVRSGKEKDRRYYKIGLKNRNESKTVRNIKADLVDLEPLDLNSDTIPLHLQSKTLLSDLRAHLPLRLCFTENRKARGEGRLDLNPEAQATVDVIRWEYDGQKQQTFFLSHTKEGVSGEIPLGKYLLSVKITADDVPGQEKKIVIGKQGQEFKLWPQETNAHV